MVHNVSFPNSNPQQPAQPAQQPDPVMTVSVDRQQGYYQDQQTQQAVPEQKHGSWNFHTGLAIPPISRSLGSDYYNRFKKALDESIKNISPGTEAKLIGLDRDTNNEMLFSSIILTLRRTDKLNEVSYHILTLEQTGDPIPPTIGQCGNVPVEIMRLTGDSIDSVLVQKAEMLVKLDYPGATPTLAYYTVIPNGFNIEDPVLIHSVVVNTVLACHAELDYLNPLFTDIDLTTFTKGESELTVNLNFTKMQIPDAVGNPVRSDFRVALMSKMRTKRSDNGDHQVMLNQGNTEIKVSEMSGFVDLLYAPSRPEDFRVQPSFNNGQPFKYIPNIVITDIAPNFSHSVSSILLSIYNIFSLGTQKAWYNTFNPKMIGGKNSVDITDIGGLNIDANIGMEGQYGTRIDTSSDMFSKTDMWDFISKVIAVNPAISLDCPETGPQTWYLDVFKTAAMGGAEARSFIIRFANQLTGNKFSEYFNTAEGNMFSGKPVRVHNGYWIDNTGVKKDIRCIDYLAVCNLSENNPENIKGYSDTFNSDYPLEFRMYNRRKVISGLSGENAVFTGFTQRVTFHKNFLEALFRAISATGVSISLAGNTELNDYGYVRNAASYGYDAQVAMSSFNFNISNTSGNQRGMGHAFHHNFKYGQANI